MADKADQDFVDELARINLMVPLRERQMLKVWHTKRAITQVQSYRPSLEFRKNAEENCT
jgi:hypothetical protein